MSTFYNLPATGEAVSLYTHLVVREDAHTLYGFATLEERAAFRQLIRISGVGARTALAVLSGLSVSDLAHAVALQDAAPLTRVPGIGKKTAERLLLEQAGRSDRHPGRAAGLRRGPCAGRPRLQRQGSARRGEGARPRHPGRRSHPGGSQGPGQVLERSGNHTTSALRARNSDWTFFHSNRRFSTAAPKGRLRSRLSWASAFCANQDEEERSSA
jgi:Helix-hairpin-helix domain/RuvA N terminal domain